MAGDLRLVNASGAPPGGHYSHSAVVGGFVFVSGHLPVPPGGDHDPAADFETQAARVLDNLAATLVAAGSSYDRLVKLTAYVIDIGDWPAFDRLYGARLGTHRPARCVVPVPALHYGYRIEVEAIALAGEEI